MEMTVPLNDLVGNTKEGYKDNHEKRRRVKSKNRENTKSIFEANKYLFSTKSNELVSSKNRSSSEKKSLNDLRTKEKHTNDKYNFKVRSEITYNSTYSDNYYS